MNCMEKLEEEERVCPICKEPVNSIQSHPFIPKESTIGNRYILGKGLQKNAESLSYVGYDFVKKSKVYIKEFFPQEFCVRSSDGSVVPNSSSGSARKFKVLLEDFCKYFRSVARHRNLSSLAAVYDILEQNNTTYVVFEWIDGVHLDEYLSSKGGFLNWKETRMLFMPLLSALIRMETAGVRHLGISPSSLIVTDEGKIKLTNFATKNIRTTGSMVEPELFDGCSALEQYIPDADIFESTDVYGFIASLFFALTGEYPASAIERKKKDKLMMPSNILKELPENVVSAIANALKVYPNNRTISFESLRIEISNSPVLQVKNLYGSSEKFECKIPSSKNDKNNAKWGIISCVTAILLLMVCFGIYWYWVKSANSDVNQQSDITNMISTFTEETSEDASVNKIDVPQLVGKTVSDAEKGATSGNPYTIVVLSEEFHDSVEEGDILYQSPAYGEKMYAGSVIAVNVSKGPEKRTLPEISGKSLSEASLILTDAKFKPSMISERNNEYAEGTVIGYQGYSAGDSINYGSEVVIVVSKGQ